MQSCDKAEAVVAECVSLQIDDETLKGFGNEYWDVTIATGRDGKLRAVRLSQVSPPVA